MSFRVFESWEEVLSYASLKGGVWYHPPLNTQPVWVRAEVRGEALRMIPRGADYPEDHPSREDPFTADETHLDRMRRLA